MCAQRQVIYTELYRVMWGLLRLEIHFEFYSSLVMSETQIPLAMFNRHVSRWHRCSQDFPEVGLVGNRHSGVEKKTVLLLLLLLFNASNSQAELNE